MRTTVNLDDELVAQAKALDINISAICREAIAKRVAELTAAKAAGMSLIRLYDTDGQPVSFWGRLIAQHPDLEISAYFTAKGAIVVTEFVHPATNDNFFDEQIISISPSAEEYMQNIISQHYDENSEVQSLPGDTAYFAAIAEATGTTYHRPLDI